MQDISNVIVAINIDSHIWYAVDTALQKYIKQMNEGLDIIIIMR